MMKAATSVLPGCVQEVWVDATAVCDGSMLISEQTVRIPDDTISKTAWNLLLDDI
jgi:hypothetical protein